MKKRGIQDEADAELLEAFGPKKRAAYKALYEKIRPLEEEYQIAVRTIACEMPTMKARIAFYDRVGFTRPKL